MLYLFIVALIIFVPNIIGILSGGFFKFPYIEKYKNSKSPIFKIDKYRWDDRYKISKYELTWNQSGFDDIYFFIPFFYLFKFKSYKETEFIIFRLEDLEKSGLNLEEYYNKVKDMEFKNFLRDVKENKEFQNKLDKYNQEFNQNNK